MFLELVDQVAIRASVGTCFCVKISPWEMRLPAALCENSAVVWFKKSDTYLVFTI